MPTGSSWRHHTRRGCRLNRHGDSMLESFSTLYRPHPFYALLYSIKLHFAADRKQLVMSHHPDMLARMNVPNKCVKFRGSHLNRSGETRPKIAVNGFFRDNFRLEIARDIVSGVALEWLDVDALVTFGNDASNRS